MNIKGNTFVVGDIHGAYRAFIQCLEKAKFDYNNDLLISLGDVFDGWSEPDKVIDEMLKISNLIYIRGNHDEFALKWAETGIVTNDWILNSGLTTINCYPGGIPDKHLNVIKDSGYYYLLDNILFVHGGIEPDADIKQQQKETLMWDRNLFSLAIYYYLNKKEFHVNGFDEIYIGHSPLHRFNIYHPVNSGNVWLMDTGAGWNGCLSMMNIVTHEFFTSDIVTDLYPDEKGRF